MDTTPLELPDDLDAQLSALAERLSLSKAALIREALETFLRVREVSLLERAGDLAGCLEGPGDLSHNRDHLSGFGA